MNNSEQHDLAQTHPSRSNRLVEHYRTVGKALLTCEELAISYRFGMPGRSSSNLRQAEFQEGVCLVPVEVLESYLEDLLDREISDEALYLRRKGVLPPLNWFALGGILTSLSCGLYTASTGVALSLSLAITILLSSPFVIMWHISPGWGVARRMLFAQIVSQEITRRRGGTHIGTIPTPWSEPRHVMGAFMDGPPKVAVAKADSKNLNADSGMGNICFFPSTEKVSES